MSENGENGKKYTFLEFLKNYTKIVIPKIQRDYAQGREDTKEVRDNFIESINDALSKGKELVLDYIYGSDNANFFYPIDGQQRLTTLFLLHWYIGSKENRLDNNTKTELKKFSYEIRDTTKEFCNSLIDIKFDVQKEKCVEQITTSNKYFKVYDNDQTIKAMLVMIEEIHKKFQRKENNLWDNLDKITFWALSLEKFGLTDDLFVKMNARGKHLSRFDIFKSDLESALDKRLKEEEKNKNLIDAIDSWKINIDNEYLELFWKEYGKDFAERNIFRLIMFIVKCLNSAKNTTQIYDDIWERNDENASYSEEIKIITGDENILHIVCNVLKTFNEWGNKDESKALLIKQEVKSDQFPFYLKVRLFGILYWWAIVENTQKDFDKFNRILKNYVNSFREYSHKNRVYNSNIDKTRICVRLKFIKNFIDKYVEEKCSFEDFIKKFNDKEEQDFLSFEREKLNYSDINKIIELEQLPTLNTLIHNIFFDSQIHIEANELKYILNDSELKNLCLRIIPSFADHKYGRFNDLVFDATTNTTGYKQLHYIDAKDYATGRCHKYFIKDEQNSFGNKVLTSSHDFGLSNAVKEFTKVFHSKYYTQSRTIKEVLNDILKERLNISDFKDTESILWYIVKYKEFFYKDDSTTYLILRRKQYGNGLKDDDNVYDIRCMNESLEKIDKEEHYQPFYLALCHYLSEKNSKITIAEKTLKIKGVHIEYANPCMLSNGWRIRILHRGSWKITFNGNLLNQTIVKKYNIISDDFTLENPGVDCIELIGNFIIECN